jgi:hypothetical protein
MEPAMLMRSVESGLVWLLHARGCVGIGLAMEHRCAFCEAIAVRYNNGWSDRDPARGLVEIRRSDASDGWLGGPERAHDLKTAVTVAMGRALLEFGAPTMRKGAA